MSSTLGELLCMQLLPVMFRDRWMCRSGLLTYAAALGWNLSIKSGLGVD